MSTISIDAKLVMDLRNRTGAGMMECKKFLIATNGNIEEAIMEMRKAGTTKADKKADRIAAEGVVVIARAAHGGKATMVEINSETDFSARDKDFNDFANKVVETALNTTNNDITDLANQKLSADTTVEQARQELIGKIGENIQLRRIANIEAEGVVGYYLHGSRIGVMVAVKNGDETLAKDIAMHIAANKPMVVSREQVPAAAIDNEREIFTAQAKESGKPQDIIDKMIEGRINKFIDEVSLLGQPYVKDPNIKVVNFLKKRMLKSLHLFALKWAKELKRKKITLLKK